MRRASDAPKEGYGVLCDNRLDVTTCSLCSLQTLAPETFGLNCAAADICLEDHTSISETTQLRDEALSFVAENIGPREQARRVLFCHSVDCFARFRNPAVAALYVWGFDTLIINDKTQREQSGNGLHRCAIGTCQR